jgi:hypothetical protein
MPLKGLKHKIKSFSYSILCRFDQSKIYTETLIEAFPNSIELWIELLVNPEVSQNIPEVNF